MPFKLPKPGKRGYPGQAVKSPATETLMKIATHNMFSTLRLELTFGELRTIGVLYYGADFSVMNKQFMESLVQDQQWGYPLIPT